MNPTTARLHRVSSSLLQAAPGGTNQFGDRNQTGQGRFGTSVSGNADQQRQQQPPPSRQHSKFVWAMDLSDDKMLDIEVSLKKEDYGELGSSDYQQNQAMATAPMSEEFGVARHKILTEAEEGDQSKYSYVQAVIVQVLHWVKQGESRAKAVDWMDICTIPFLIESNLYNPSGGIARRSTSGKIGMCWS